MVMSMRQHTIYDYLQEAPGKILFHAGKRLQIGDLKNRIGQLVLFKRQCRFFCCYQIVMLTRIVNYRGEQRIYYDDGISEGFINRAFLNHTSGYRHELFDLPEKTEKGK